MEVSKELVNITHMDELDLSGKTVLLRVDINSPIDPKTKKIVNENRIKKSIPTIKKILDQGAKLAIIAHQGDTLDYDNLISMEEHAEKLTQHLGRTVEYIDDTAGPAARAKVKALNPGEAVLLGNVRYYSEEISTFETVVKLTPQRMCETYLVKNLAPLVDVYINDAFAAAHRNAPSMVAFQQLMPYAGGLLLMEEVSTLSRVMKAPEPPCVFVLGGAKISDAFGMMEQVLEKGTADKILAGGITGEIMLLASGIKLGNKKEGFIKDRGLDTFIPLAKDYLSRFKDKIVFPLDLAYEKDGKRVEVAVSDLPLEEMFMDIGEKTIEAYCNILSTAKTIFANGPMGAYENSTFELGTKKVWEAMAAASGYTVIGGGDTVAAAQRFVDVKKINYVSTAGGAMVQYMSGKALPLIEAMEKKG